MEGILKEYVANRIAICYGLNKVKLKRSLDDTRRGRPKSDKRVISSMIKGEELIGRLIAEAKIEKREEMEEEEEEEEEIIVKKFIYKEEEYLKAMDDTIYNKTSHDEIGRWNGLKGEIEFL